MHTTCVPVVLDVCHTPPYIAQAMGAKATLTTHRMHLLLTADQNAWLEGQATGLRNKSAVVRDLIDSAMLTPTQGLTGVGKLATCSAGAGVREVERVPAVQAVMPDQPAPQPHLQPAVQQGAVEPALELEPEKKIKEGTKFPKSQKPRAKKTKGSPEFEEFWGIYQSAPMKANKQAKPQAWEVWQQLVPDEISAADLVTAINVAIQDMDRRTIAGEFCSSLPDCFRWLRDECYSVFLESYSPRQASGITVLS